MNKFISHFTQKTTFCLFWTTPASIQGLLIALHSGITTGRAQGAICGARNSTLFSCMQDKRLTHYTLSPAYKT